MKVSESIEVPPDVTQDGIAEAVGIDLPHFAQYVRPLVREGLVMERVAHVKGSTRRRKAYLLTDAGKFAAVRFRDGLMSESMLVRDENGVHEVPVADVLKGAGAKVRLLRVLRQVEDLGAVNLAELVIPEEPHLVEMLTGMPVLRNFVGREKELGEIVKGKGGPRIFVVRGIAGIGKTSLAAKACDLLRGKRNLFWHRVRPWDTRLSILAGLGDFLSLLGRPGIRSVLRQEEAHRAAQVLAEDLATVPALLVFDDAHEATEEASTLFSLLKDVVADARELSVLLLTRSALTFYDRRDVTLAGLVREIDLEGLQPAEVEVFFSQDPSSSWVADAAQRLGGHPLFLELVRAHAGASTEAFRDVGRFIEEQISEHLSDAERRIMKTASLYRVPVPREALFSDPALTYEDLGSLLARSLVRATAGDRFELHDAIQGFLDSILTPSERKALGVFVAQQLRSLASEARNAKDFASSIAYLSNAIAVSQSPDERSALLEEFGDVQTLLGDMSATETAYVEATKIGGSVETVSRLHRKMADTLHHSKGLEWAIRETEAGLRSLGEASSPERGHLNSVRSHVEWHLGQFAIARGHAEEALRIFQEFNIPSGQAWALLSLATAASLMGDDAPAERYFRSALDLANSVPDRDFEAQAHFDIAEFLATRGRTTEAAAYLSRVKAAVNTMENLSGRAALLLEMAWFACRFLTDFESARSLLTEAIAVSRLTRDPRKLAECGRLEAMIDYFQNRLDEASEALERIAADLAVAEDSKAAADALTVAAECQLLKGDVAEFQRVVRLLQDPRYSVGDEGWSGVVNACIGISKLLASDREGFHKAFGEALRADKSTQFYSEVGASVVHLYYGACLRAIGREREARAHLDRATEFLRAVNHKARLSVLVDRRRRLTEAIRKASKRR